MAFDVWRCRNVQVSLTRILKLCVETWITRHEEEMVSITLTFFEVQVGIREMPLGSSEPSLHTGTCASLVLLNPSKRSVILSLHNIPVLGPTQRKCEVWFKLLLCCTNFPIYPAICFYLAVGDAAKFLYFMEKGTLYDCTYRLQRKV